jgi:phage terminase small subunit
MARSPMEATAKQNAFILAMLQSENVTQAAKFAGVGTRTAHRWVKQPFMQARLKEAQKAAFEKALRHLQVAAIDAAIYLHLTIKNTSVPDSVRVRAAAVLLEHATGAHIIEQFAQRIEQLEAMVNEQERGYRAS